MISVDGVQKIAPSDEERVGPGNSTWHDLAADRNRSTRLCRMPDEIIAQILWYQQALITKPSKRCRAILQTSFGHFDLGWVRTTLVCRRLRRVALDTPYLWSVLECQQDRLQWSELCLKRAKNASLTMHVPFRATFKTRTALFDMLINKAAPRIRCLHVDVDPKLITLYHTSLYDLISHLIDLSLPQLEWLVVSVPRDYNLGQQFMNASCQRLEWISIKNLDLGQARPPPMPSLVCIHFAVRDIGPGGSGLRALLMQTPSLECLEIQGDHCFLHDPYDELEFQEQLFINMPNTCIRLPRLRILHLTAKITWVASILNMVPIPSEALYIESTSGRHLGPGRVTEEVVSWDFDSKSARNAYEVVHCALIAFWRQTTGDEGVENSLLPDARLVTAIVDATVYIGHSFRPEDVASGRVEPFIHYHTRGSLRNFIPLARHITALHLIDDHELPDEAKDALINVCHVIVRNAYDWESLAQVISWFNMRSRQGHPLAYVDFTACSRVFVHKYVIEFARAEVAGKVTWNGEVLKLLP